MKGAMCLMHRQTVDLCADCCMHVGMRDAKTSITKKQGLFA